MIFLAINNFYLDQLCKILEIFNSRMDVARVLSVFLALMLVRLNAEREYYQFKLCDVTRKYFIG